MKVETKLIRIGSSLGVIIPNLICKSLEIEKDSQLIIEVKDDKIIITKEG